MQRALVVALSIAIYGTAAWAFATRSAGVDFSRWPADRTVRRFWFGWLVFLFALSPLTFHAGDMRVWVEAMQGAVRGEPFAPTYVYLPIYAQVLGALLLPFAVVGVATPLVCLYVVHIPIFAAYVYCAKLMAEMIPRHADVAPLAIVLAPVTIFYIFFGTNHIVMLACLLVALRMMQLGRSLGSGLFAGLACYKFLLVPTIFVLAVVTIRTAGWRRSRLFIAGALASLVPSVVYYGANSDYLVRTLRSGGGMGGHSHHIEPFHAFYRLRDIAGFEDWYVGRRVWLYAAIAGALVSAVLYLSRRLNALQSLGVSAGVVALVSVEPFRMEPTIGLLWMDAVERRDLRLQTAVLVVVFTHAAAWFYPARPNIFAFYEPAVRLFDMNGTAVGLALAYLLVVTLLHGSRDGLLSSTDGR